MTLLEEINSRHRNFHRAIERKATIAAVKNEAVTSPINAALYYHRMWFWDLVQETRPTAPMPFITVKSIMAATERFYGVTHIDMTCNRRTMDLVVPRQVAMYLCKTFTRKSLPEIGRWFGNRDHTTVLHAVRKIERLLKTDAKLASDIAEITAKLPRGTI